MLICEELDAGVWEDTKKGCGMAFEESAHAGRNVDVSHRNGDAGPGAGVFCEVGVAGLEEDLYTVKGADYGFGLALYVSLGIEEVAQKGV